jgi:HD-GYP domain-containing protein (c-di-GMP phosphodiesterase class II)
VEDALTELRRCSGAQFDPDIVEALERVQYETAVLRAV